jgi:hypothetical protein
VPRRRPAHLLLLRELLLRLLRLLVALAVCQRLLRGSGKRTPARRALGSAGSSSTSSSSSSASLAPCCICCWQRR